MNLAVCHKTQPKFAEELVELISEFSAMVCVVNVFFSQMAELCELLQ